MLPITVVFTATPLRISWQTGGFYLDSSILLGSQPWEQKKSLISISGWQWDCIAFFWI